MNVFGLLELIKAPSYKVKQRSEVRTSGALIDEMLDQIPESVWEQGDLFLDPCCGRGTFLLKIINKLRNYHSDESIQNMIHGIDIDSWCVYTTKLLIANELGCDIDSVKIGHGDFIEKDFGDMKFVVVGNPPYQKGKNKAKRWTNWILFVEKSLQISKIVAMVVPQSLTAPGDSWKMIRGFCTVISLDVKKFFDEASTFCYFVANPNKRCDNTKIITSEKSFNLNISEMPFLPNDVTDNSLELMNKLFKRKSRVWKRGELHTSNDDRFSENGKYRVIHTNAQELRSDFIHENLSKIRVVITLSGYPKFQVIQNAYASQACFWTEFETIEQAEKFASECNSEDIQEMLTLFKWSGWNSREVIELL